MKFGAIKYLSVSPRNSLIFCVFEVNRQGSLFYLVEREREIDVVKVISQYLNDSKYMKEVPRRGSKDRLWLLIERRL